MAKDISEELYAKIKESFDAKYEKAQLLGEPLHSVFERIKSGDATFRDADMFSVEVGSMLSDSLKEHINLDELPNKTFYRNIAQKTLGTSLKDGYGLVSNVTSVIQEEMNAAAGIGLKVVKPKLDVKAVDNIVNRASAAKTQEELEGVLTEPVKTFVHKVSDDTAKANARLHNRAGLAVKVEREYDGVGIHNQTEACQWCLDRHGKYSYEEAMDKGVFERHEGCGCIITYTSKKGEVTRSTGKYGSWTRVPNPDKQQKNLLHQIQSSSKSERYLIDGSFRREYANDIRNDKDLSEKQVKECKEFAELLGMPKDKVFYSAISPTRYGADFDILIFGTDIYPREGGGKTANGKVSYKGGLAHEIIGHRETVLRGTAFEAGSVLDEAQASFRAARLAPYLDAKDRYYLIRDGLDRLHSEGLRLNQIKSKLDIY